MERCTARAAGGTKNRLKPGAATVFSRSKNDAVIDGPVGFRCRGQPGLNMPLALDLVTNRPAGGLRQRLRNTGGLRILSQSARAPYAPRAGALMHNLETVTFDVE